MVSVEDYLRRTEKPNAEYWDGIVHVKPWPTGRHSFVQTRLLFALDHQRGFVLPELTVRLSPTRWLVPDVTVVERIEGDYPTEPVLLVAEVLSPEQSLGEMLHKCEKYHAWGVPYCWVIDPDKRTAWEYHKASEPVKAGDTVRGGELAVALADLFAGLR